MAASKYHSPKLVTFREYPMAEYVRRSTRIPKQLAILLVGSDMEGRMFTEETKTAVLSRHGAGLVSEYPLSPEQELILRLKDTGKEAEVRVVGQLGEAEGGGYMYGVAFLDPNLADFWGIDFPAPSQSETEAGRKLLECSSCKGREVVNQSDVEADVFAINEGLVRYCNRCGMSTIWKLASGDVPAESVAAGRANEPAPQLVPAPIPQPPGSPPSVTLEPVARDSEPQEQVTSAYSRDAIDLSKSMDPEAARSQKVTKGPEQTAQTRKENRRKHVRTRVNFKACVRYQDYEDDIVSCEDMSRGGLRFKSSKKYPEKANIELAAPYEKGSQNIFVAAQIVHVQELPAEKMYRYGVMYLRNR